LLLLDPDSGAIVATLFWELSNAESWGAHAFDLTAYAGQTLRLHFGVYNDGADGQTGMYVDNVALVVERPASAGGEYLQYLPLLLVDAN
jgi:bacillopeptidase F (M6 metalloprotease family)